MKKYNQIKIGVTAMLGLTIMLLSSCKKFIEVEPSPNLITSSGIFKDDRTAIAAVLGLYLDMRNVSSYYNNGGMSLFGGLYADEIYNTTTSTTYDPFVYNSLQSTNGTVYSNFYSHAYKNIYRINSILEGLANASMMSDSVRKQLEGEMKFSRAFQYFYLLNIFGDVPLVLTTKYEQNASLPRTAKAEIYTQMVTDLKTAQNLLQINYPSVNRARPNKWVATALLGRVYLYLGDWLNAEKETSDLINSGTYSLVTNLSSVFIIASNETIWQLPSANEAINTAQGGNYIPSSATVRPTFAITNELLAAFEPGDQRRINWLKSNTISATTYVYPFKFKSRQTATPVVEYNIVLRLAEQYLIRAEARIQQDKLTEGKQDINIVRQRAGLSLTSGASKAQLLQVISHERQVELFTEWGDRWFDLKRTGLINQVMSTVKGTNWQSTDALYPIPLDEIEYNPRLTQNPGY